MKYHVIINGCSNDYMKQAQEVQGFITNYCLQLEPGNTVIICRRAQDKERLARRVPTASIIFIILEYYQPEIVLSILEEHMNKDDIYLFTSDFAGNELAVRAARRMDGSSIIGGMDMHMEDEKICVSKLVYSSHLKGIFLLNAGPYCISLAKGIWQEIHTNGAYEIINEIEQCHSDKAAFIREIKFEEDQKAEGLENAKLVVIAGRGVQKKEAIEELREMTKHLHGKLGVSRPVAMSAWAPMEELAGVSGAMLKPEICIAVGVSGAAALYAGIEKSKFIIAINIDRKAPIIKKADVAIIDDYKEVIKALVKYVEEGVCIE